MPIASRDLDPKLRSMSASPAACLVCVYRRANTLFGPFGDKAVGAVAQPGDVRWAAMSSRVCAANSPRVFLK